MIWSHCVAPAVSQLPPLWRGDESAPGAVCPWAPVSGRARVTALSNITQAAWSFVAHLSTLRKGSKAGQCVGLCVQAWPQWLNSSFSLLAFLQPSL